MDIQKIIAIQEKVENEIKAVSTITENQDDDWNPYFRFSFKFENNQSTIGEIKIENEVWESKDTIPVSMDKDFKLSFKVSDQSFETFKQAFNHMYNNE